MRAEGRIAHTDRPDRLALDHPRAFPDIYPVERAVDRVVAATVLEDYRVAVSSHRARVRHRSRRHRLHHSSGRRADADSIPPRGGVVRIHETAEPVQKRTIHGPIQSPDIRRSDRAW